MPTDQDVLEEMQEVRFFHPGTKEPFPLESQEFKVAVSSTVRAIRELFKRMSNRQTSVYLATGSIEMEDDRSQYCETIGGRLPTEAEWEYAARADSTSARYGELDAIAWSSSRHQAA